MKEKYTAEGIAELGRKQKKILRAAVLLAAATLAGCIALCFGIRTRNADLRRALAIGLGAAGAWGTVYLLEEKWLVLRREEEHETGVLRNDPEPHEGVIGSLGERFRIPRSIAFFQVTLREDGQEVSMKLNARIAGEFPREGESVRLWVRRGYITGWETDAGGETPEQPEKTFTGRRRGDGWKKALRVLRRGLACALVSIFLGNWVFNLLTDADRAHKIVLFAGMRDFRWKELAVALEEEAPEEIRFVQVHPFSYALMDSGSLRQADLYIMTDAQAEEHPEWISEETRELTVEGQRIPIGSEGLVLRDGEGGEGPAKSLLNYGEAPEETWRLYFGAESTHAGDEDHAAERIAETLLSLP